MIRTMMLLICVALLSSCASYQKKEYRTHKFLQENPTVLAQYCENEFPVKEVFLPGEEIIVRDTVEIVTQDSVACPDGTVVKCPECKSTNIDTRSRRVDTLKILDSAKMFLMEDKLREAEVKEYKAKLDNEKLEAQLKESQKSAATRKAMLIGIGVVSLLYGGYRLKRIL